MTADEFMVELYDWAYSREHLAVAFACKLALASMVSMTDVERENTVRFALTLDTPQDRN